jgi:hypothetical protein
MELVSVEEQPAPTGIKRFEAEGGFEAARVIAKQLDHFVKERRLSIRIGRNDHLLVAAWCALGAMVGVSSRTAWVKEVRGPASTGGEFEGYTARVEVVSRGEVVGAAECGCYVDEKKWKNAERHSLQSMAQTRATSKSLGQVLRWIPELAGYSGTPAEEMTDEPKIETLLKKHKIPELSLQIVRSEFSNMDPDGDEVLSMKWLPLQWAMKTLFGITKTEEIPTDRIEELKTKMNKWSKAL